MEYGTPVKLRLDEENSLIFEVKIEGELPSSAPIYRFICENDGFAYAFRGIAEGDTVQIIVPALNDKMKEGLYDAHLEVIIENKLLIPLQFKAEFMAATKVHVESIKVKNANVLKPTNQASTAKLLSINEAAATVESKETIIETKTPAKKKAPLTTKNISTPSNPPAPIKHLSLREIYQNFASQKAKR